MENIIGEVNSRRWKGYPMRRVSVLGVELRDYSVKESMKMIAEYLNNGSLDTVCLISTDVLVEAKDDNELKGYIEAMDMTVPVTEDILHAAELNIRSREKEVQNNTFLKELMRRLAKEKKKIFLLAETEHDLVIMREALLKFDSRLTFFGSYAYENLSGTEDAIINEINSVLPDVIFSYLETPKQERLIQENKMKVNAQIWVALRSVALKTTESGELKRGGLHTLIDKTIFKRVVSKYENKKEDS